jgi:glycosyltransferase involved in cell wall biosynthesis
MIRLAMLDLFGIVFIAACMENPSGPIMIHFFPTFSKDASDSPFARELSAQGVPHRIFSGEVLLRYPSRIRLVLLGWPKVIGFALKSVIRSLLLSRPYPDTVVVGSHIEALIFGFVRTLMLRRKPEIVLLGFIYTNRRRRFANFLRRLYFRFVFSIVDRVICYSRLEVKRNQDFFPRARAQFVYIPYGLHIHGRDLPLNSADNAVTPYILSAGRSGRDYATLFEAVTSLPIELHVLCDSSSALTGLNIPPNVKVLRSCYDAEYVDQIRNARFVVIPLGVADISAGQMVLIQAMAFAKPSIITRTATVEEYVTNGEQSLLVAQNSAAAMREAIQRLLSDQALAERLSANAIATYDARFCMRAYVRHLMESVTCPIGTRAEPTTVS